MTNTRPNVRPNDTFLFTEAAKLLGVDRKTIYRWRKLGYLPVTRPRMVNHRCYVLGKHILRVWDAMC